MSRRRWDDRPADEVCPPFPLLRLLPEMRRQVLKFVVSVSPNHGARFFARQARETHPRDQTEPGFPLEAMDHARAGRATCTHWSTAACLTTVMHHTRTTRTVCSAIRGDVEALEAPRSPLATPRVWLSHLYEVPAAAVRDMSGQQVLRELRARSLTGRRANLVAEMQWRQDKLFDLNGPARTNFGRSVWSDRPRNSYELVAKCPAAWSKKRKEAALALARNAKYHDDGGGGGGHCHSHGHGHGHNHHAGPPHAHGAQASWALTKVRTHEERHAVAPIDASLLGSLEASAYESFLSSLRRQTWTAYAEFVTLTYQNSTRDGETVKEPTPDVVDEVGRRVAAFFGETTMAQPPWIRQWTNKVHHGEVMTWDAYEDECKYREGHSEDSEDSKDALGDYHDADRPILTRWQDVFQTVRSGSRAERTELALVHDQNPAPAVAKLFATVHALQMPAEENAKTRHRCILFSSVKCLGGQHPHPEAHCTFHVGGHSCYSNDRNSYLNSGELTVHWRDIPQFELEIALAFPSLS